VCSSRSFAEKAASRLRGATVSGRDRLARASALLLMQPGGNHSGRELVKWQWLPTFAACTSRCELPPAPDITLRSVSAAMCQKRALDHRYSRDGQRR
jgi:hypothetical protein